MSADAFADFRVGYEGLCLRDKFDGEFSDDDEVSSTVSVVEKVVQSLRIIPKIMTNLFVFCILTASRTLQSIRCHFQSREYHIR